MRAFRPRLSLALNIKGDGMADEDLEIINESGTSDEWVKDLSESSDAASSNNNANLTREKPKALHLRWEALLGVRNRPDPLLDWDQLYNLANQSTLRRDCTALCQRVPSTTIKAHEVESLITLYCKRRELTYASDNGWLHIMEVLLAMPFDLSTLYNVFYAITTKYIPRDTSAKAKAYDLFRLLVQYHDAELCSYLDSLKIGPQAYAVDWFNSLLSTSLASTSICCALWNSYFERGDPFIVFFIALSFLQATREQLLKCTQRADALEVIRAAPRNMGADDVDDLLDVCLVTLNCTPASLQQDFHCLVYGSNLADVTELPLDRIICMPISAKEISKSMDSSTSRGSYLDVDPMCTHLQQHVYDYFIIDARTHRHFVAGSIYGAYNLNAHLLVDAPEAFRIAMTSLLQYKSSSHSRDHVCFIGSGGDEEDDACMMMVISRFLQQSINHVSYVDGGYRALHALLRENASLDRLNNHSERCQECCTPAVEAGGAWSLVGRVRRAVSLRTDAVKSSLEGIVAATAPAAAKTIKHARSAERNGKRYRNQQSIFTNDSDLSDDEASGNVVASLSPEKYSLADLCSRDNIYKYFEGNEIFADKTHCPCALLITYTHMFIYHKVANDEDLVRLYQQHALPTIVRVTSKRRVPEFLTFKFGHETESGDVTITRVHCFLLSKSGDCAAAIKQAMHKLGALSSPTAKPPLSVDTSSDVASASKPFASST